MTTPKSFIKANSQMELNGGPSGTFRQLSRIESLKGNATDNSSVDTFGPLSNVRFAVFALGSSAYPNFCAFGKYVDTLLGELGGERLLNLASGDEMCGQDQAFRKWAGSVFNVACETFCLDDKETLAGAAEDLGIVTLSEETVRFKEPEGKQKPMIECLQSVCNKKLLSTTVLRVEGLGAVNAERNTIFIEFEVKDNVYYQPGDHVGILACNKKELVNAVLDTLEDVDDHDKLVELQQMKETHTSNGILKTWELHERLAVCSVREMFTRFLDITTPPSQNILQYLASCCTDAEDTKQLQLLATEPSAYEDWRHFRFPTLPETLQEFRSARPRASLLAALLSPLQPRFYSISSSPDAHPHRIHLTVAVVTYKTQDGKGPVHYGVCSNFLGDRKPGDEVFMFIRSAPSFHLPDDLKSPIILIGPGTGIAPFRGFWHHRKHLARSLPTGESLGPMWLFFGCRTKKMDLYMDEKQTMLREGILSRVFLALSREENVPKTYVQGLAEKEGQEIYNLLFKNNGHFYVCGDCTMAEDVYHTLKGIIKRHGQFSDHEVENYMLSLRDDNRYHEDIFGITLRTAEIHSKSRESARIKMASQP